MKQALVDIEDSRFYEHNGLDVQGTAARPGHEPASPARCRRAARPSPSSWSSRPCCRRPTTPEDAEGRRVEQTVGRKLEEARLALALEQTYSKDEILTRYLNIVYFGEGAYGIQAAAQQYFSVDAADLTLPQAADARRPRAEPAADDPIADPDNAAHARRNQVLQRMHTPRAHQRPRSWPTDPAGSRSPSPGGAAAERLRRRRRRRVLLRLPAAAT